MAGTLGPADTARLTDFARTLKAAARAVVLYPDGHPAVRSSVARLVDLTSDAHLPTVLRIGVTRDSLLIDGDRIGRPDGAVSELASLLHSQLVGELTIRPPVDAAAWQQFLRLLGRGQDEVRSRAAAATLWTDLVTSSIAVREIDYAELLRERSGGIEASWEQIVAGYLTCDAVELDGTQLAMILEQRLDGTALAAALDDVDAAAHRDGGDLRGAAASLMRVLRGVVQAVQAGMPDRLAAAMDNLAASLGRLSADAVLSLLEESTRPQSDSAPIAPLLRQMPDDAVATFLARNIVAASDAALGRVAQAFQALVVDEGRRERLVKLVGGEAGELVSIGGERSWPAIAETLLTRAPGHDYVPQDYARELSKVRAEAIRLEQSHEDPPERLARWRGTVATEELRRLDQQLITDLLHVVEPDHDRHALMPAVRGLFEDLWQAGDFAGTEPLLAALLNETSAEDSLRASTAHDALAGFLRFPGVDQLTAHLASVDESQFECAVRCVGLLGESSIRPLVEAMAVQERSRVRERLTAMVVAFGPLARPEIEQLATSPNPATRRTATFLLRELGASTALPDPSELLDDREPMVQREAVRAILKLGVEPGYRAIEQALARGTGRTRNTIMQAVGSAADRNAAPLLVYLAERLTHRGALTRVYVRALELLGGLADPESVPALRGALNRGEWWAPRRTAALRKAAATALASIDAPVARRALEDAATHGSRGVRAAARAVVSEYPPVSRDNATTE
jgi:hypothetical protein